MYTQSDFNNMRRANAMGGRTGSERPNGTPGFLVLVVVCWVLAFVLFSAGGAGIVIGVLLIFAAVIGVIVWGVKRSSAAAAPRPASAYPQPTVLAPMRRTASAAPAAPAGHLCDEDQHAAEMRDSAASLDNLQTGYRDYSTASVQQTETYHDPSQYSLRGGFRTLSREEFRKKADELRSLLGAGIISPEEYRAKLEEYSSFT